MLGPARGALHEEPNAVILHVGVCEGRGPRGYGEPTRARSRKRRIQPRGYLRPRLALSYSEIRDGEIYVLEIRSGFHWIAVVLWTVHRENHAAAREVVTARRHAHAFIAKELAIKVR